MTKTCGNCRFFESKEFICCHSGDEVAEHFIACYDFEPIQEQGPTNGDKIRQKARGEMNKKCPDCGSLNIEEVFDNEAYCKDCFLHCATADLEDATIFDVITQSPEVLAAEFVEKTYNRIEDKYRYYSILTGDFYDTEAEAIAATLAKLNEVANGN